MANERKRGILANRWRGLAAFCGAATLLAAGCNAGNLRLLAVGLDAALNQIAQNDANNISFGDWIASEFQN